MDSFGQPLIPKFRLLVKTHKSMMITTYGGFASRPLVGMFQWATTPCSVLIGVPGLIVLKIDRAQHPLSAPLVDSYELLARLRSVQDSTLDSRWRCSTIDVSAMCTRITWAHVVHTFNYWRSLYQTWDRADLIVSSHELSILDFVFAPVSENCVDTLIASIPYLDNTCENNAVGLLMLNYVFHHTIFLNPGVEIYHQCQGWPLGTNAAPAWAQLTLRSFESAHLNRSDLMLFPFLDDGPILHGCTHDQLKEALSSTYPPNLPFSFDSVDCVSDITFLGIHIVELCPLRTPIFWKPKHTCSYISWGSNIPRHIKTAWIRGEFIRYIRVCSSLSFYHLFCTRLIRALHFLGYPAFVIERQYIHWSDRWKFLILHRDMPDFTAAQGPAAAVAAPPPPPKRGLAQPS